MKKLITFALVLVLALGMAASAESFQLGRGVTWGMSLNDVDNKVGGTVFETYDGHLALGISAMELMGVECSVSLVFDDDRMVLVESEPASDKIPDMINTIKEEFGEPTDGDFIESFRTICGALGADMDGLTISSLTCWMLEDVYVFLCTGVYDNMETSLVALVDPAFAAEMGAGNAA